MKHVTEKQILKRIEDWGLDPDSEEDYYTAEQSLYYENGKGPRESIYDDEII